MDYKKLWIELMRHLKELEDEAGFCARGITEIMIEMELKETRGENIPKQLSVEEMEAQLYKDNKER